jgi:hypothetical protein
MLHLPYVASRVFGTPLMIARAKLEVILGVLTPRLIGSTPEPTDVKAHPAPLSSITVEKIAVISVIGTLVSRSGYLDAASGLQSYGEIGDAVSDAMNDPTVRGIILDVDSPGGEVGGLFDLVEQLQAVRSIGAKPLWAVANESALSAAYAIASATQRLYVTRYGSAVGARSVQQLRETAIELQLAPVRFSVHIPVATLWAHFQGGDVNAGLAELEAPAKAMIDDLLWWTAALKTARATTS